MNMDLMSAEIEGEKYSTHEPEVRLNDGSPLYHALLGDAPVVTAAQTEAAKNRFNALVKFDANAVAQCEGKPLDEAATILLAIEARLNQS